MNPSDVDVLLAEDNASDGELILRLLREVEGVGPVHRVYDGVEALDFLLGDGREGAHEVSARLVLLDIKLPRVGGLEVLSTMRSNVRTRHVPVVMLTSSRIERDVRTAYDLGANAYVEKPVDFVRLREVVHGLGTFWLGINEPPPALDGADDP